VAGDQVGLRKAACVGIKEISEQPQEAADTFDRVADRGDLAHESKDSLPISFESSIRRPVGPCMTESRFEDVRRGHLRRRG
jgi:hypothetical protein